MFKKVLTSVILATVLIFSASAVYAAIPSTDTYVFTYGGEDIYVKAGSFYRTDKNSHPETPPQFECDLIYVRNGNVVDSYHAKFWTRGLAVMNYRGKSDTSNFAQQLYEAICFAILR